MKYFLNHISPTLAAIARALACEGIGHTHSHAEEIRTIERVLRQLYPAEHPPEDPLLFAAILAVHAMTFGVCAAEASGLVDNCITGNAPSMPVFYGGMAAH